jgi:hypothetical protein
MLCRNIRKKSFGFLPAGVEVMMPVTERAFRLQVERMNGVLPRGDQVRRTEGL